MISPAGIRDYLSKINLKKNIIWSQVPLRRVSDSDHRKALVNAFFSVGKHLEGPVNLIIAGVNVSEDLRGSPSFSVINSNLDLNPHLFGHLNGVEVYRILSSDDLGISLSHCLNIDGEKEAYDSISIIIG